MIDVIRASCRTSPPALAVALILLNCTYLTAEDGFVPIFDGQTLQGWHVSAKTGHSRASKHQIPQCGFCAFEEIDDQLKKIESMRNDQNVRITGLIKGERFTLPDASDEKCVAAGMMCDRILSRDEDMKNIVEAICAGGYWLGKVVYSHPTEDFFAHRFRN
jgi:hypothetical protein